ncbi:hypothetical protein EON64_09490 [archaeon]|nr:MAG: hypothetical protein EON64_09490 [archaeon]
MDLRFFQSFHLPLPLPPLSLTEQMLTEEEVTTVLTQRLSLKLMHFDHLEGAPSQVVSQLVLTAHSEGYDYFYQINDDTVIVSPNWPVRLMEVLQNSPLLPNMGVTGPTDSQNEKIFTHSFTHRTHIDVRYLRVGFWCLC